MVSPKATVCPHCGAPRPRNPFIGAGLILAGLAGVTAIVAALAVPLLIIAALILLFLLL